MSMPFNTTFSTLFLFSSSFPSLSLLLLSHLKKFRSSQICFLFNFSMINCTFPTWKCFSVQPSSLSFIYFFLSLSLSMNVSQCICYLCYGNVNEEINDDDYDDLKPVPGCIKIGILMSKKIWDDDGKSDEESR